MSANNAAKELRAWANIYIDASIPNGDPPLKRRISRLISAALKEERERCAKVVEMCGNDELYEAIARAVREGKPVTQCYSCGLFTRQRNSNGECIACASSHL